MIRLLVYLKGFASGALGMLCGYLLGWCVVSMLHAVPFLRIGRFEVRGNIPGMIFGIVIAILCARSTMRSEIKRQREQILMVRTPPEDRHHVHSYGIWLR